MALLDPVDPTAVIYRSLTPFLEPEHVTEQTGQVPHVVFAEGLVPWKGEWLLFHGMGDSAIGIARAPIA